MRPILIVVYMRDPLDSTGFKERESGHERRIGHAKREVIRTHIGKIGILDSIDGKNDRPVLLELYLPAQGQSYFLALVRDIAVIDFNILVFHNKDIVFRGPILDGTARFKDPVPDGLLKIVVIRIHLEHDSIQPLRVHVINSHIRLGHVRHVFLFRQGDTAIGHRQDIFHGLPVVIEIKRQGDSFDSCIS